MYQCDNWPKALDKRAQTCHTNNMKNETTVNLSTLAATGTKLDLAIAEAQGKVKVTRLTPAKPRRGQLVYTKG